MLKTTTLYAIKRDNQYLVSYMNHKAEWSPRINAAWCSREMSAAKDFSGLIKGAEIVELTIIERVVKP